MGVAVVREFEARVQASQGNSYKFTRRLNDYLLSVRNITPTRDRTGFISPSGTGGCPQWTLNQLRGEPRENHSNPWDKPFLDMADLYHDYYQMLGVEAGVLDPNSIEQWVEYKPLKIGGAIDGQMVDDGPLVDFKTCDPRIFERVVRTNWVKNLGVEFQMHCYMKARHVNETQVIYINRATPSQIHEIDYKWSDEIWSKLLDWISPILEKIQDGTSFPRDDVFDWNGCMGCQYHNFCSKSLFRVHDGKTILVG
jgi:hypothetical protein